VIVAAAMVKAIHTSTLKLFEKYIGPTQTSFAKKKSRLIHSQLDETLTPGKSPYPTTYLLEGTGYTIINHANVFSRASLDIGTRFFLQHLPRSEKYQRIIDLACGNGVVGLMAAEKNPQAELFFLDESYMAIASAEENFRNVFSENRHAVFKVSDGLQGIDKHSVDLILNNPPFHQQHSVTDEVAWNMFQQSKAVLKQGGELLVIGNRHLGYHVKLKKLFGNCKIIANNKKFVILQASKK
jgi:23S rRNA (guanine1835-N2)-methyltransferase